MENGENTGLVLRRCKIMNCVYAGQSFSMGIMDGELGGRETTAATMKTMTEAKLVSPGSNGVFVLTSAGADAIAGLGDSKKPGRTRPGNWQARRTVEKPS